MADRSTKQMLSTSKPKRVDKTVNLVKNSNSVSKVIKAKKGKGDGR